MIDEISLEYWKQHRKKEGSSKSYSCVHDGYIYGDDMQFESIEFVYLNKENELICQGKNSGPKWAYFDLVEKACQQSQVTFRNFSDIKLAEKFRIYTKEQVISFSPERKNSTRIKKDEGKININGEVYYVAHNLKVCEYFNNAANCIDPAELSRWFIRISFDDGIVKPMSDRDENESIEGEVAKTVSLALHAVNDIKSVQQRGMGAPRVINLDYSSLNQVKKRIGDIGEEVVLMYEKQRLIGIGHCDWAELIEHSSAIIGDGLGYDIMSYQDDGSELYIEVKTTKQNKPADFYLSKKEKKVADEMCLQGKAYRIYRVYNLNTHKGTGDLVIFEPPFTSTNYLLEPENWKVSLK